MYNPDKAINPISKLSPTNRPNIKASTDANSDKLGVYINDSKFEKFYKNNILTESPVASALGDEGNHVQRFINAYNLVDFFYTSGVDSASMNWNPNIKAFGNWRTKSKIQVNKHVILHPEDMQIKLSASQEFEPFWDKVMGNNVVQMVDKVAQNARMFNTFINKNSNSLQDGIYISKYQKTPVLKSVGTLTYPSSLKFTFQFGQAGLFSAEEEVVKPILAIADLYMPSYNNKNAVFGSAPSTEYAMNVGVRYIAEILGGLVDKAKDSLKGSSTAASESSTSNKDIGNIVESAASRLTGVQEKLYGAMNEAAERILGGTEEEGGKYKCIVYRIGRLQLPPLIVKDVSLEFDFSSVDEYGFPYRGSISLDGLESVMTASSEQLGLSTLS